MGNESINYLHGTNFVCRIKGGIRESNRPWEAAISVTEQTTLSHPAYSSKSPAKSYEASIQECETLGLVGLDHKCKP